MMTHELLPWEQILAFVERRKTLNRQKLLDTLRAEAIKREGQAKSIRKAIAQIETETWENEDR
jgi:transcriptional regulator NrdR family protein